MSLEVIPTDTAEPPIRERRIPVTFVLLLVALAVTAAGVLPFRQIIAQGRQEDLARAKRDALVAENDRLHSEIGVLETPQEVERIAREQYGLVNPGEIPFRVVSPPDDVVEAPEQPVVLEEDPSVWRRIWDFLTGRDLDPDG